MKTSDSFESQVDEYTLQRIKDIDPFFDLDLKSLRQILQDPCDVVLDVPEENIHLNIPMISKYNPSLVFKNQDHF